MILSMATLYDKLLCEHFDAVLPLRRRGRLSVSERRNVYVMELKPEMDSCAFQVDGYIIKDKTVNKCDYVVLAKSATDIWSEVYVELKGSDVIHAIKQLKDTIMNPLFSSTTHFARKARVVTANRIPSNAGYSIIERAKVDFKKIGCDFRPIKSKQPDVISF